MSSPKSSPPDSGSNLPQQRQIHSDTILPTPAPSDLPIPTPLIPTPPIPTPAPSDRSIPTSVRSDLSIPTSPPSGHLIPTSPPSGHSIPTSPPSGHSIPTLPPSDMKIPTQIPSDPTPFDRRPASSPANSPPLKKPKTSIPMEKVFCFSFKGEPSLLLDPNDLPLLLGASVSIGCNEVFFHKIQVFDSSKREYMMNLCGAPNLGMKTILGGFGWTNFLSNNGLPKDNSVLMFLKSGDELILDVLDLVVEEHLGEEVILKVSSDLKDDVTIESEDVLCLLDNEVIRPGECKVVFVLDDRLHTYNCIVKCDGDGAGAAGFSLGHNLSKLVNDMNLFGSGEALVLNKYKSLKGMSYFKVGVYRGQAGIVAGELVGGSVGKDRVDPVSDKSEIKEPIPKSEIKEPIPKPVSEEIQVAVEIAFRGVVPDVLNELVPGILQKAVQDLVGGIDNNSVQDVVHDAVRQAVQRRVDEAFNVSFGPDFIQAFREAIQAAGHEVVEALTFAVPGAAHEAIAAAVPGAVQDAVQEAVNAAVNNAFDQFGVNDAINHAFQQAGDAVQEQDAVQQDAVQQMQEDNHVDDGEVQDPQ